MKPSNLCPFRGIPLGELDQSSVGQQSLARPDELVGGVDGELRAGLHDDDTPKNQSADPGQVGSLAGPIVKGELPRRGTTAAGGHRRTPARAAF
jgi:hypothetical protein